MLRDAQATRARILSAATTEFSAWGFAGARVDRIAAAAETNKRMIYVYYGDKEALFEAALQDALNALTAAVPITEDDLPGYAAQLFDYVMAHPEAWRLSMWRQLERPTSGPQARELYASKVAAMRGAASVDGTVSGLPALDLLVLVQAMAGAWLVSPPDLLAADGADPAAPERLRAHRSALACAVQRLVAAPDGEPGRDSGR